MKRHLIINALTAALLLLPIGAAHAITNGQPDGSKHPYVGLLVFDVWILVDARLALQRFFNFAVRCAYCRSLH